MELAERHWRQAVVCMLITQNAHHCKIKMKNIDIKDKSMNPFKNNEMMINDSKLEILN